MLLECSASNYCDIALLCVGPIEGSVAAPSKILWGALFLEKPLVDLVLHRTGTFRSTSGEVLSRHQTGKC